jgi:hypothetical protein
MSVVDRQFHRKSLLSLQECRTSADQERRFGTSPVRATWSAMHNTEQLGGRIRGRQSVTIVDRQFLHNPLIKLINEEGG